MHGRARLTALNRPPGGHRYYLYRPIDIRGKECLFLRSRPITNLIETSIVSITFHNRIASHIWLFRPSSYPRAYCISYRIIFGPPQLLNLLTYYITNMGSAIDLIDATAVSVGRSNQPTAVDSEPGHHQTRSADISSSNPSTATAPVMTSIQHSPQHSNNTVLTVPELFSGAVGRRRPPSPPPKQSPSPSPPLCLDPLMWYRLRAQLRNSSIIHSTQLKLVSSRHRRRVFNSVAVIAVTTATS